MRIVIDLQGAQSESRFRGIGRYSLALTKALIRDHSQHEYLIVLNDQFPDSVHEIRETLAADLPLKNIVTFQVLEKIAYVHPGNRLRATLSELLREQFLASLRPDAVLVTSLFEGHVDDSAISVGKLDTGYPTAVVLYDLIPFLNPEKYLPGENERAYYFGRIESLLHADLLLAISENSRQEAIKELQISPSAIATISTAADEQFKPYNGSQKDRETLPKRLEIERPFILYAPGGFDDRKNFYGLLHGFGALDQSIRDQFQIVIVSKTDEGTVRSLRQTASEAGLHQRSLVITGYLHDDELIQLYQTCFLFVYPSKHEGFGLPALEAMSCGAPTIGSGTTSVPEVIGFEEALFDPLNVRDIAAKMHHALTDETFRMELIRRGKDQVKLFSWEATATRAVRAIETLASTEAGRRHSSLSMDSFYGALADRLVQFDNNDPKLLQELAIAISTNLETSRLLTSTPHQRWRLEGPFDSTYSLALVNRELARGLITLGHQVELHSTEGPGDFPPNKEFLLRNPDIAEMHSLSRDSDLVGIDVVGRNLFPPRVSEMSGKLKILHCYGWEESGFPAEWIDSFNLNLHGITCMSEHVRKVLLDNGIRIPVRTVGIGCDHWLRFDADPSFQIKARGFRFLHVSSCFPRKGADTMLRAFGRAFTSRDDVTLVIKTFPNPHNEVHRWLAEARAQNSEYPDVLVIEDDLTDPQLKSVYQQCHALVAPSRAEGFGLPLAEAMLSGLPVITTRWSGQLDFCDEKSTLFVDYEFVPAESHFQLFDSVWAEPDTDSLARAFRKMFELPESTRRAMADHGQKKLLTTHKWTDVARSNLLAVEEFQSVPISKPAIGWVTTWNTKCGIATYSEHLVSEFTSLVEVLANRTEERVRDDEEFVTRCWVSGEENDFGDLEKVITDRHLDTVVIQFNFGFYNLEKLGEFIEHLHDRGVIVVVVLHATIDPPHVPTKKLANIHHALGLCDRLIIHSIADLNRLKGLGLIHNVLLFPHGVLELPLGDRAPKSEEFRLASYGFLLPHKGIRELVEAFATLYKTDQSLRLSLVNSLYPAQVSHQIQNDVAQLITNLGLTEVVDFHTSFLADDVSLGLLKTADLLIFPYQATNESASGAVRYGIATQRPVAVTPLAIFDDVRSIVHTLPGTDVESLTEGLASLIAMSRGGDPALAITSERQKIWCESHAYPVLAKRLDNILGGLARNR